jgi:hypothetical protein
MRILKVEIVHQEQQDSIYKEVGLGADIVEVLEDGYINLDDVSGAIANYDYTNVLFKGGQMLLITMDINRFVAEWIS